MLFAQVLESESKKISSALTTPCINLIKMYVNVFGVALQSYRLAGYAEKKMSL